MSLLRLNTVSLRYDTQLVLRDVSFRLEAGERVGLIGSNGTGKTTILRLLLGELEPSSGRIEREPGIRIGYFSQFSTLDDTRSAQALLEALFADARAWEGELAQVATALETARGDAMTTLLERQEQLIELMNQHDGWEYPRHIDTALTKLGFNAERRAQPVSELSGGWRNRAALAQGLLTQPDVLLLDEPTNYLDIEGVAWLEAWLTRFPGAVIVVSHDRRFLDSVVTRIVEVENYGLHEYPGAYTEYVRTKPLRRALLDRQFQHVEELLLMEAAAIRDHEALRRSPEPGVLRKLADLKKRQEPRLVDTIVTGIYAGLHIPDQLCRVEDVAKRYGAQQLFHDVTFSIEQGDRLAIVGANGSGKSTLLRVLTRAEAPDAGRVVWEGGVTFADFNEIMATLDEKDTVTHAVNVTGLAFNAPRKQVNRFLELLRFSEHDLKQRIGALSGGQRARVALARCLLSGAAVVVLDEPTNHLDVPSIQVLERALAHFPGAVVVVSHDRFFIDSVATRLLAFTAAGEVQEVSGNWTHWSERVSED